MKVEIPLRLGRGLNDREGWWARARRVKHEKETTAWMLAAYRWNRPQLPCVVTITRVSPSAEGLDSDNAVSAGKNVRDAVAKWFDVDDSTKLIDWQYRQRTGAWCVEIEFT